jgi:hypothetical protein
MDYVKNSHTFDTNIIICIRNKILQGGNAMGIPALTITNPSVLGKMLVESAIFFEASAAELIGAEGQKLQALVAAATGRRIPVTTLIGVNEDIADVVCCLSGIENAILRKIAAGTHLIRRGF